MFKRLLIPLDGSQLAECTIPFGLALQRAFSSTVVLQRVLEPDSRATSLLDSLQWRMGREAARSYLLRVARPFQAEGGNRVEVEVTTGPAPAEIIRLAKQTDVDLVLLSTHGKGGLSPFPVSGTAHKVASAVQASVLLVRASTPGPSHTAASLERILVALDGSPRGEWAAHVAASIAAPLGSELLLVHVVSRPEVLGKECVGPEQRRALDLFVEIEGEEAWRHLASVADSIASSGMAIRKRVAVECNVARAIDEIAEEERASLVVLGAHGRSVDTGWQYGSVAANLIENGRKPLLVLQDAPRRARSPTNEVGLSPSRNRTSYAWRP